MYKIDNKEIDIGSIRSKCVKGIYYLFINVLSIYQTMYSLRQNRFILTLL